MNGNYSAIFKIWDRVFGTLVPETKVPFWMQAEAKAAEALKVLTEIQTHTRMKDTRLTAKCIWFRPL